MKEEEALKNLQERIGSKLTELRKKRGYTSHEDFAFDYDIPRVQYWRIEKGRTNLTLRSLVKLLSIHKMSVEEFFTLLHKNSIK